MRKVSIFKKLAISSFSLLTVAPIVLTATSCSKNSIVTRYSTFFAFKDNLSNEKDWKMETNHFTNEELLTGTKKFCDGNYLLFVGSSEFIDTRKFFGGASCQTSNIDIWFNSFIAESILYNDLLLATNLTISDDFGLVSFIDDFEIASHEVYDSNGRKIDVYADVGDNISKVERISPFMVWDDISIGQTYTHNQAKLPRDWMDECVSEGEYVRQDEQAKAFRSFCLTGAAMFPIITDARSLTFSTSDNASIGNMVLYKDGKLLEIQELPAKLETDPESVSEKSVYGLINKHFIDSADED